MTSYLIHIEENQVGLRIDSFLSANLEISRTKVASDIDAGAVKVNGKVATKSQRLNLNDEIKYVIALLVLLSIHVLDAIGKR